MSTGSGSSAILQHTGRIFSLYTERVTLPSGVATELDVIRHPGAAAIVAVTTEQQVVLIEQYRHAVGGYIWEIPAGTLEAGENPLDCARRELHEETGFRARNFDKLAEITPLPAYSDERIHIFLATQLESGTQNLDADELLRVQTFPMQEALEMTQTGKIQDAKTIAGLQLAARRFDFR